MAGPAAPVPAKFVGQAFISQYYFMLYKSPGLVHKFYKDISRVSRREEDGTMSTTTTVKAINAKILSLNYSRSGIVIKHVDSQDSLSGGVHVLVTGYLTRKDDIPKNFSQSFLLAPQDPEGYFVLNDIFHYMGNVTHQENANHHEEERAPTPDVVKEEVTPVQKEYEDFTFDRHGWTLLSDEDFTP